VVGFSASQTDVELFAALGKAPDAGKYANVARFYSHIASFSSETRKGFPAAFGGKAAAAPAAKKEDKKADKKAAAPAPAPAAAGAGAEDDDDGELG
jgi:elongation factor 1-beta